MTKWNAYQEVFKNQAKMAVSIKSQPMQCLVTYIQPVPEAATLPAPH